VGVETPLIGSKLPKIEEYLHKLVSL
jgi:hypothetical protein